MGLLEMKKINQRQSCYAFSDRFGLQVCSVGNVWHTLAGFFTEAHTTGWTVPGVMS